MTIYQSVDGDWIAFDGQAKRRYATEEEARMAARDSAVQTYEKLYRRVRSQARDLIAVVRDIELIRMSNPEIAQLVADAEAGALVGDSTLTKEAAQTALALLASFQTWSMTPLMAGQPTTPLAAIYRED